MSCVIGYDVIMKRRINLHIRTTNITLLVDEKEEHLYRQAQRMVNDSFDEFANKFNTKTIEELWAHTAFRLALNYSQLLEHADLNPVLEKIDDINKQITDLLTENQGNNPD